MVNRPLVFLFFPSCLTNWKIRISSCEFLLDHAPIIVGWNDCSLQLVAWLFHCFALWNFICSQTWELTHSLHRELVLWIVLILAYFYLQRSLATDLQNLSMELRKKQSTYLKRLRQQKEVWEGLLFLLNYWISKEYINIFL
jgi:hypothetical protein